MLKTRIKVQKKRILLHKKLIPYQGDIKKLTKSNSYMVDNLIFYIVKKDIYQKPIPFYAAYEYKSKYLVNFSKDKNKLINWLERNIDKIKIKLEEHNDHII